MRSFCVFGGCLLLAGVALADGKCEEGLPLDLVRPVRSTTRGVSPAEAPRDEVSAAERDALQRVAQGEASLAQTPQLIELLREVLVASPASLPRVVLGYWGAWGGPLVMESARPELTRQGAARLVVRLLERQAAGPELTGWAQAGRLAVRLLEGPAAGPESRLLRDLRALSGTAQALPPNASVPSNLRSSLARREREVRERVVVAFERYASSVSPPTGQPQLGMDDLLPGKN